MDNLENIVNLSSYIRHYFQNQADLIDLYIYREMFLDFDDLEDVRVTLSDDCISKLETLISDEKMLDKQCNICLEKYSLNQELILLKCRHYYHKSCITKWLSTYNVKCPVCRTDTRI